MKSNINHKKAMSMLNQALIEMKNNLQKVDNLPLKGSKKKLAKRMHEIYEEMSDVIHHYEQTHARADFNLACHQLEILKPTFTLNYNEILQ